MLVKGFTYGLVLCTGTIVLAYSKSYGRWDPLLPFYIIVAAGGFAGCWILMKNMKEGSVHRENEWTGKSI